MNFDPPALLHGWAFTKRVGRHSDSSRPALFYLGSALLGWGLTHSLGFDKKSYKENYIWTLV